MSMCQVPSGTKNRCCSIAGSVEVLVNFLVNFLVDMLSAS
jgi:hypothetical protein